MLLSLSQVNAGPETPAAVKQGSSVEFRGKRHMAVASTKNKKCREIRGSRCYIDEARGPGSLLGG